MRTSLGDSSATRFLFRLPAPVMESRLRHRFFDPVKALKAAGVQRGLDVLEVRCGTGFFTVPAAKLVSNEGRVCAVDPHSLAIQEVRKRVLVAGLANVRLIRADATQAGVVDGCFDLGLLLGVIPSPALPLDRLLPEMHRLPKLEGTLAVWTAVPWWPPVSVTRGELFVWAGKTDGVHSFRKARGGGDYSSGARHASDFDAR